MRDEAGVGLRRWRGIAFAAALIAQWFWLHACSFTPLSAPELVAASAGLAIFGAAFALSWAAEAAQVDVPESLSLAFLALIAVLPEYAVDIYFAWEAGSQPHYVQYATANMTGANRLLIGLGWPVVVFAYALNSRRREIRLVGAQRAELFYLLAATAYSFVIPWKGTLSVFDSVVLVALFGGYVVRLSKAGVSEPELDGVAEMIATLPSARRRAATAALFAVAGAAIFTAAEPFAESLLAMGHRFGIDEFLLVQWLAPLASESPEFIVAVIFALKLKPAAGFSALLSSKVNQWTLLIGTLPVAYAISTGAVGAMHLDERQRHEILLTSAQSLFAIVMLCDMRFGISDAVALLGLFAVQLAWPDPTVRLVFVWIYLGASLAILAAVPQRRRAFRLLLRAVTS